MGEASGSDKMDFDLSEDVELVPSFEAMGLKDELLRGVFAYGFEKPSAIQQRAIMPILKGRDTIAQEQSWVDDLLCRPAQLNY